MKVVDHERDPVFVGRFARMRVELRIGEAERGKPRYAYLEPSEARLVAYALLTAAERIDHSKQT